MNDAKIARIYWSHGWRARLYRRYSNWRYRKFRLFIAKTVQNLKPARMLDVACGTGVFLTILKQYLPEATLYGTDLTPGMLAEAPSITGITLREAPAHQQPFTNQSFDVVTTLMAFHHFPDPVAVLREMRRTLKPGGIYIIADVVARARWQARLWNFLERAMGMKGYIGHYTKKELEQWVHKSGFTQCSITAIAGVANRYRLISIK